MATRIRIVECDECHRVFNALKEEYDEDVYIKTENGRELYGDLCEECSEKHSRSERGAKRGETCISPEDEQHLRNLIMGTLKDDKC